MTTIDPFTTPAEAEREARVEQAEALLADGARTNRFNTPYRWNDDHRQVLKEDDAPTAMYAAQAATAHALLAVRDELADIAESLRTLAAMPGAVQWLSDHVSAAGEAVRDELRDIGSEIHDLCATVSQGVEFADSTAAAVGSVAVTVQELTDAVMRLSEPKPRWWHRLRRTRRQVAATDLVDEGTPAQEENPAKVHEFRVDLRQHGDPQDTGSGWAAASRWFRADKGRTPWETAQQILADLCEQVGVPADPSQVYGQMYACDQDGRVLWFIDTVFLPAADLDSPGDF